MSDIDLLAELASLPSGHYTPADRYHDFRKVFTGSEEGKRVLEEILRWGHLLKSSVRGIPIDPYLTHINEGESNMARKLLATVYKEPPPEPKTQTTKR